jgi:hypothetical protein
MLDDAVVHRLFAAVLQKPSTPDVVLATVPARRESLGR